MSPGPEWIVGYLDTGPKRAPAKSLGLSQKSVGLNLKPIAPAVRDEVR
jgi:hypothetical protein